jgi:hypothetical protein
VTGLGRGASTTFTVSLLRRVSIIDGLSALLSDVGIRQLSRL